MVSHIVPTLGMERVTIDLLEAVRGHMDVELWVIGGSSRDESATPWPTKVLGPPLRGPARLATLWRMAKARRSLQGRAVVLVGAWAALPTLATMPRSTRAIVWEHSLLRENVAASRTLRIIEGAARLLYRRARAIVAVSDPLAADLTLLGLGPVRTVANIVSVPEIDPLPRAPRTLCTLGTLNAVKNQGLALRTLSELPSDYRLLIIGDGPMRRALQEQACDLNLATRVVFAGYRERQEALSLVAQCEILLHTSYGETFGLAFLEALAVGTKVVATDTRLARHWAAKGFSVTTAQAEPLALASVILEIERERESEKLTPDEWSAWFGPEPAVESWLSVVHELHERG